MTSRNSADAYDAVAKTLHWIVVALVVAAWTLGTFMDVIPRGPARGLGITIHLCLGLSVLTLMVVRIAWRLAHPAPPPIPSPMGRWADFAARSAHILLYALLVVIPLVGIGVQFYRGRPLPIFGLFEIPSPKAPDRNLSRTLLEVHEWLANGLMALAVIHAVAALVRHWVFRDRTLLRMLPGKAA